MAAREPTGDPVSEARPPGTVRGVAVPAGADEGAARAIVRREIDPAVAAVERIGEGEWSRGFAFRSEGRDLVIRIGSHRSDFARDRRAAALATPDLPVPAVLALGGDPAGWWCVSTRAGGTPLELLDVAGWETALPSVLALLDALAAVAVDAHDGWGPWVEGTDGDGATRRPAWAAHLLSAGVDDPADRVHGWSAALAAHPADAALHRRALQDLAALAPALHPPRHLVHADLVNRNVLVDDGRVSAVFDWGCALVGDPLFDVAWLDVWTPWHPAIAEVRFRERALAHRAARGADLTDAEVRIRACQLHILCDALADSTLLDRPDDVAGIRARLEPLLSPA